MADKQAPTAGPATRRPLATVSDLAEHYGVSRKTVYDWIHRGVCVGPLTFRIGTHRRARWEDIDRYDAQQVAHQREVA